MDIQILRRQLYEIMNQTDELEIVSLVINPDVENQLLIELRTGDKYKISIEETDEFV